MIVANRRAPKGTLRWWILVLVAQASAASLLSPAHAAEPAPIAVKMVVVANFENGQDAGDKPGEFQFWVEREHLDETVTVRGATHPIRRNGQGLYGLLLESLTPFVLDSRFDFSNTYWLFTPQQLRLG
jgi:purine nucleoside permease